MQALPATVTTIAAPSVVYGKPATVTVSVTSFAGAVTGTVTLTVNGVAPSPLPTSPTYLPSFEIVGEKLQPRDNSVTNEKCPTSYPF